MQDKRQKKYQETECTTSHFVNHFIKFAIQYTLKTIQINVAIVTQSLDWTSSSIFWKKNEYEI